MLLEDPQVILVCSGAAQHVQVKPNRRPPVLYPRSEVFTDRRMKGVPLLRREDVGLTPGMQPGIVEDLVYVDVAYARHHLLVQQEAFDLGFPRTELLA